MAVNQEPQKRKIEISPASIVIVLAIVLGIAMFAWLTYGPKPAPPPPPVLTADAKSYLPNLKLSDVQPQTSESYIQKSLFEIIGKITNAGDRRITSIKVNCVFRDYYGQELNRELATILSGPGGSLDAGATKPFRLAFDDLPDTWNRQMPDLVIAQITF